jgi:small-conductance mechanosensitive channel
MKRYANTFLAIGAALLLGGSAIAQQDQQQRPSTTQEKPQMSMDDMMEGCREHCQQTSASIDRLMQRMDEARQSNDPAKMRAMLDEAQKPLADMKQHMNMCMNMMGMMQKMHGKTPK